MIHATIRAAAGPPGLARRPRVGFLGVGWIGRNRMQAMLATGSIEAAAVAEPSDEAAQAALALAPKAERAKDLAALLDMDLDGLVIATPSALHAEQTIQALRSGAAVFCQKPLGRTAEEVRAVVEAAQIADRLLGVDLSYRCTSGMLAIRDLVGRGELGEVFAADLVFHNAYGPDKPWFYHKALSGGGCVMDLGVHLVDLALWTLGYPAVETISSTLLAQGEPVRRDQVEDYAVANLTLAGGASVRIACSWRLPAGREAIIEARFYGKSGGAAFANVGGSFYDFRSERLHGTASEPLAEDDASWGGRAAAAWAERLAQDRGFDPDCERLIDVAEVLDRIYGA
jgi:predicted dehydrogenase